ncbi:hypothetical protein A4H97_03210 [Niastella yeongjuensis]|uniref:Uncharacterized protein n=1 Tax=Niastella yeongjuensis TaxID=354355 RepID=A0A1V9EXL3_9BACT|nr:hypothetical protein A4H97_03210 [Niastella yeongjuensis]
MTAQVYRLSDCRNRHRVPGTCDLGPGNQPLITREAFFNQNPDTACKGIFLNQLSIRQIFFENYLIFCLFVPNQS